MASRGWAGSDSAEARSGAASTSAVTMGTTRNRSELFFKYRRQARGAHQPLGPPPGTTDQGLETARLLASALGSSAPDVEAGVAGVAGVAAALPPQYVDFKEQLRVDMAAIRQRMGELRALHGRASLSQFDDTREEEVQVEVMTQAITKMFRRCEARLQQFGRGAAGDGADDKIKRNVQRTLAVELQRLSVEFRRQQKQYLQRVRSRDGRGGGAAGGGGASGGFSLLDDGGAAPGGREGGGEDGYDAGFSDVQSLRVDTLASLVDERDRETQQIVSSIHELAQIMKDLSVLVIDQGTVLDRIDYNLEQTAAAVDQGVDKLRKAERTQRRGTAASCVLILLAAVVALTLLLVVKALLG